MQFTIALLTLYMFQNCNSVIIDGGSIDPFITVDLGNDPEGNNQITDDNYWQIYEDVSNPSDDWALQMRLNSDKYGFQQGKVSKISIEMDGYCEQTECDAFWAFSIGNQYITFANAFDNVLVVHDSSITGTFIYPSCNTGSIASGDASQLRSGAAAVRDALAGGDSANWHRLSATDNGNNFPVTFEFINDDITDTFTVRFKSPTFRSGLECVYNSALTTGEDFEFYLSPDGNQETIIVRTLDISGLNIGVIDDGINDPHIMVDLTNDPRGINGITSDGHWMMAQYDENPLYDWALKMTLESQSYGFQSGQESILSIEMDGFCDGECDAFYAFSVGDQYITFAHDFDGELLVDGRRDIFIYPACNSQSVASGDASQLIGSGQWSAVTLRDDLAGGDAANWYQLSSSPNGRNFPVTFEFINDDITDTFTFTFKSSTFPSGLECVYNSALKTGDDFNFYFTPDTNEDINIKSFDISGENIGVSMIDGDSNEANIVVELTNDPRGINEITGDGEWKIYQSFDDPLLDWPLKVTLNSGAYAFQSGKESTLTIEMDGYCESGECDAFWAFSVGDEYITFANDFDGRFNIDGPRGIFIYPACNSNLVAMGDASQLIPSRPRGFTTGGIKGALAGGDSANWHRLSSSQNGHTFPVTFEFINDDITDTFTFRFKSSTFRTSLECVYDSALTTGQDFKFYLMPDGNDETIKVQSFQIFGENIGADCEFCHSDCAASGQPVHGNEVKFVKNPQNINTLNHDEPLNVRTIIWSGVISMIISLMTVFISYIGCIKPKTNTQIYDKLKELEN